MGFMTLEDFRQDVASAMQRTVKQLDTKRIDRWVNLTMIEFGYAFKFRELEGLNTIATVIGTASYSPFNDWRMWHELGIRLSDNSTGENLGRMIPETREVYLQHINTVDSESFGQPSKYHQYNANLYIRPVPDDIYVLNCHYWKKITPLAAPTDLSPFKDDWDEIILTGAIAKACRAVGELDRMTAFKNEFLGLVRSRVVEEDIEQFPEGGIDPYPRTEGELETGLGGR